MEGEKDEINLKAKNYIEIKNIPNSRANKVILLDFLIIFLLCTFQIYAKENKNNISKKQKMYSMDEKVNYLKLLTNNVEPEYKGIKKCLLNNPDRLHCIYHLLVPKQVVGKKRILLGEKYDGCYVLLDDFKNIKIAYSFGISSNIQFDKALADKGIDIYMYDHTINSLPYENSKFHWKKIGICGVGKQYPDMKNLEELIKDNGHIQEKNMILKMDVEEWEWDSINTLKEYTLKQFKYIAIEFHFKDENDFKNNNIYYNVIKKLSKTHQVFFARCNADRGKIINFGYNRICHIMEVSYIIKQDNIFIKDDAIYPIYELDHSKPQKGVLEFNLNLIKVFED